MVPLSLAFTQCIFCAGFMICAFIYMFDFEFLHGYKYVFQIFIAILSYAEGVMILVYSSLFPSKISNTTLQDRFGHVVISSCIDLIISLLILVFCISIDIYDLWQTTMMFSISLVSIIKNFIIVVICFYNLFPLIETNNSIENIELS